MEETIMCAVVCAVWTAWGFHFYQDTMKGNWCSETHFSFLICPSLGLTLPSHNSTIITHLFISVQNPGFLIPRGPI